MTTISRRKFLTGIASTTIVGYATKTINHKNVIKNPQQPVENFDNTLLAKSFKPQIIDVKGDDIPLPELVIRPNKITISKEDKMILAKTLYAEARGEGREGLTAVAHVIFNRIITDYHVFRNLNTVSAACLGKNQFSCWLSKWNMRHIDTNDNEFKSIYESIDSIHEDYEDGKDITKGSLYYIKKDMKKYPKWTKQMTETMIINRHKFFIPKDLVIS